ncbi:YtxH domain-containing protein [Ureibacillus sp. FSL K6-8385]|uniref:YtxH domain-containing protein n=1 Tax=Ureibacillus terrenus TaxID=118246 RepID=A0A540V4W9_9BACL|nr:YtxH domain-containing protein [Ureibacillus terrenus]MED3662729.1 YtxH domain-containing protein [Ureibacillus terrenus]MED3763676.1 YtxH domain-containing protein [Ureibacillus terrenus]TQE91193.1 YtxH domain-containing protein [Ureibacillus terrenus]
MSESKLCKGVVIGALVGAAVSMLDRTTREQTVEKLKKTKNKVIYYAKNRSELQQLVNEKIEKMQKLYEDTKDNVNFIMEKLDEVKGIPGAVQEIVQDTKEVFSSNEEKSYQGE